MEQGEETKYVSQLHDIFNSCDTTGTGYLDKEELTELCRKLQLEEQLPQLLQTFLGNDLFARVHFDEFKDGFVAFLLSMNDISEDESSSYLEPVIPDEVEPKYVKGNKRYGRRSKPEFEAAETNTFLQEPHNHDTSEGKIQLIRSSSLESVESLKSDEEAESAKEPQTENFKAQGQLRAWSPEILESARKNSSSISDMTEHQAGEILEEVGISHNGYLNQQDLATVIKNVGIQDLSKEELEYLFTKLDVDGDGRVSFREFQVMLTTHYSQPISSTPLKQRRPWALAQPQDDSSHMTNNSVSSNFGASHLFTSIDDGTGFGNVDQIMNIWEEEGIDNSKDILMSLDFNLEKQVNLLELTTALDSELIAIKNRFHLAAMASYKHELYHQRCQIEQIVSERDKVKQDLDKAEKRNLQLADEVDDNDSIMEQLNESKIKDLEQDYRLKLAVIRSELESEKEQIVLQTEQHRIKLEAELANFHTKEAFLREKLSFSVKENDRLQKEIVEVFGKLAVSETLVLKLQSSVEDIMNDKRLEDPEFFSQEEKFAEIIKEYETQCRELRDQNDELQMQVEKLKENKFSRLLSRMKDNKLLHQRAREKIHHNEPNNVSNVKKSLSMKLRRSASSASVDETVTMESESSPMTMEAELTKYQLKEQQQENQDLKIQIETKVNYYERELELMKTNFEKERKDTEQSFKIEISELEEQKADLEALNAKYQEVIDSLKEQLPNALKKLEKEKAEMEEYYAKEISTLRQQLSREREEMEKELRRQHHGELQAMRKEAEEELNQKLADIEAQYAEYCQSLSQRHHTEKQEILQRHEIDKKALEEEHMSERAQWEEKEEALLVQWKKEQLKLEEKQNEEQAHICKIVALEKEEMASHYKMHINSLSKEIESLNACLIEQKEKTESKQNNVVKKQSEHNDINRQPFSEAGSNTDVGQVDTQKMAATDNILNTSLKEKEQLIEMNQKQIDAQNIRYQQVLSSLKVAEERLALLEQTEESTALKLQETERMVSLLRAQLQDETKARQMLLQLELQGFEQAQLSSQLKAREEEWLLSEAKEQELVSELHQNSLYIQKQESKLEQLTKDKEDLEKQVAVFAQRAVELEHKIDLIRENQCEFAGIKTCMQQNVVCGSQEENVPGENNTLVDELMERNALFSIQLKNQEEELSTIKRQLVKVVQQIQEREEEAFKQVQEANEKLKNEKSILIEKLFELEDLVLELEKETTTSQDDRKEAEEELNQKLADIEAQYAEYCQSLSQRHHTEKQEILQRHEIDKKALEEEHMSERAQWEEKEEALLVQWKKEQLKLEEKQNEEQAHICKIVALEKEEMASHYKMHINSLSKEIESLNACLIEQKEKTESKQNNVVKKQSEHNDINRQPFSEAGSNTDVGQVDTQKMAATDNILNTSLKEKEQLIEMHQKQIDAQNIRYQQVLSSLKVAEERLALLEQTEESTALKLQETERMVSLLRAQLQDETKAREMLLQLELQGFEQAQLSSQLKARGEEWLLSEAKEQELVSELHQNSLYIQKQESKLEQLTKDKEDLEKQVAVFAQRAVELEHKIDLIRENQCEFAGIKTCMQQNVVCGSQEENVPGENNTLVDELMERNALFSIQLKNQEEELSTIKRQLVKAVQQIQEREEEANEKLENEKSILIEKLFELEDLVLELEKETTTSQDDRKEAEEELNQKLADIEAQYTEYCQSLSQRHHTEKQEILQRHEIDKKALEEEHMSERAQWEEKEEALLVQWKKEQLKLEEKQNEEQAHICKIVALEKEEMASHYKMHINSLSKEIESLNACLIEQKEKTESKQNNVVKKQSEHNDINRQPFSEAGSNTDVGQVDTQKMAATDNILNTSLKEKEQLIEMHQKQIDAQNIRYQQVLSSLKVAEERLALLEQTEESTALKPQETERMVCLLRAQLQDETKAREMLLQLELQGFEQAQLSSQLKAREEEWLLSEAKEQELVSELHQNSLYIQKQESKLEQLTKDKEDLEKQVAVFAQRAVELEHKIDLIRENQCEFAGIKTCLQQNVVCGSQEENVPGENNTLVDELMERNALFSIQLKNQEEELSTIKRQLAKAVQQIQEREEEAFKQVQEANEKLKNEKSILIEKLFELEDLVLELEKETITSQDDRMELSRLSEDKNLLSNKVEQLQQEVHEIEDMKTRHRKQVEELKNLKDESLRDLEELTKQNQRYREELSQLEAQKMQLTGIVSDLRAQDEGNQETIQQIHSKLREVTQQKEEVTTEMDKLQEKLTAMEREGNRHQSEWESEKEQLGHELQVCKQENQRYREELSQLEAQKMQLTGIVSDLRAQDEGNQETIQQIHSKLREVTQQKEEVTTEMDKLQEKLTAMEREGNLHYSEWESEKEQLGHELQVCKQENQRYREELSQLEAQKMQLSGIVSALRAQDEGNQETIQQIHSKLREVTQQKEEVTTEMDKLQEKLTAMEREGNQHHSEWESEKEQLGHELQVCKQENQRYREELSQLEAQKMQLSGIVSDLRAQDEGNQETIQQIHSKLREVTQQKEEVTTEMDKLQEKLTAMEREGNRHHSEWESEKEQLGHELQVCKQENQRYREELSQLEAQRMQLSGIVSDLRAQDEGNQETIQQIHSKLREVTQQKEEVTTEMDKLQEKLTAMEREGNLHYSSEKEQLEHELQVCKQENQRYREELSQLEAQRMQLTGIVSDLRAQDEGNQETIQQIHRKLREVTQQKEEVTTEMDKLQEKLTAMEREGNQHHSEWESEREQLGHELQVCKQENQRYREELSQLEAQKMQLSGIVSDLRAQDEGNQETIQQVHSKLREVTQQKEEVTTEMDKVQENLTAMEREGNPHYSEWKSEKEQLEHELQVCKQEIQAQMLDHKKEKDGLLSELDQTNKQVKQMQELENDLKQTHEESQVLRTSQAKLKNELEETQDEEQREWLLQRMGVRKEKVEKSLKMVRQALHKSCNQLKDQLEKYAQLGMLLKYMYAENAQLMKALQVTETRQKIAEKKNYLLNQKQCVLYKIIRSIEPEAPPCFTSEPLFV
ncbi:ninein-like protein [Discoglossus pictus]